MSESNLPYLLAVEVRYLEDSDEDFFPGHRFESDICVDEHFNPLAFSFFNWSFDYGDAEFPSHFVFSSAGKYPEIKYGGYVEWDENGKKSRDPYAEHGKDFWSDVYHEKDLLDFQKPSGFKPRELTISPEDGYSIKTPGTPRDTPLSKTFKHISECYEAIKGGDLKEMLKASNIKVDDNTTIDFYFGKDYVSEIRIHRLNAKKGDRCYIGSYFTFDPQGIS